MLAKHVTRPTEGRDVNSDNSLFGIIAWKKEVVPQRATVWQHRREKTHTLKLSIDSRASYQAAFPERKGAHTRQGKVSAA